MTKNSVLKLSETLQQKSEADSQKIQSLQQQQLEKFVQSLSDTLERDLYTTRRDISQSVKKLKEQQITMLDEIQNRQDKLIQVLDSNTKSAVTSLRWSWLRATVPSLLVLAIILSASWGLIHFWTNKAINLRAEVIQNQNTLNTLPKGLVFFRENETQYLIMQNEPKVNVYRAKSGSWVIKFNK